MILPLEAWVHFRCGTFGRVQVFVKWTRMFILNRNSTAPAIEDEIKERYQGRDHIAHLVYELPAQLQLEGTRHLLGTPVNPKFVHKSAYNI